MKNYVDKEQKAKDTKSTGYTFTLVGIVGIIFLLLINLKVIKFTMSTNQQILITVVMGIVFLAFLVIGIISFNQVKKLTADADVQKEEEDSVISDFMNQYGEKISAIAQGSKSQEAYFERNQEITDLLKADHPDLSDEDVDHYADLLYDRIFAEDSQDEE